MSNPETRIKVIAGVTAAVAAVVAIGTTGAIAASRAFSSSDESAALVDDAARQHGTDPSEPADPLKQALKNRLDEAVREGWLTEEQADALKKRIDSSVFRLPFGGLWHKGVGHRGLGLGRFGHGRALERATEYLGVDEAELRARLAGGETLAEVAAAEGRAVDGLVEALTEDVRARIDDALADGRITEEQAAEARQRVLERVTALVNGERWTPRLGRWREWWPGLGGGSPWHGERPGG